MTVANGLLPFKLSLVHKPLSITGHGGLTCVCEALISLFPKAYYRGLAKALGYKSWRTVYRHFQSLVLLIASGGDHVDDIAVLRADPALQKLILVRLSSPTQLLDFLYRFHQAEDGRRLTKRDDQALSVKGVAHIRPEGPGLVVLAGALTEVVRRVQAIRPYTRATLDVDATIVEAHKSEALKAYEGTIGYQPQVSLWAEQGLLVCDEFRDGNVPAEFQVLEFLKKAFGKLPRSVTKRYLRGDSALYNEAALSWADENGIKFAVSADMSPSLRAKVVAIPERDWKPLARPAAEACADSTAEPPHEERQWAEVIDFVPEWGCNRKKDGKPFRYYAIRVRSTQPDLLDPEATSWRHFAIVTNIREEEDGWDGGRVIRWQRQKQGTVEQAHKVMKDELAAGHLPCGRFGANAAWWRLNAIVFAVLEYLKAAALPKEMRPLRPKALRFHVLNLCGRVVESGRQLFLQISTELPGAQLLADARCALLAQAAVLGKDLVTKPD